MKYQNELKLFKIEFNSNSNKFFILMLTQELRAKHKISKFFKLQNSFFQKRISKKLIKT